MPDSPALWAKTGLLGILYVIAGQLGLSLAFEQTNTSPVWPPTGLAIAALLCCGPRIWLGIFLGACIINYSTGAAPAAVFSIAAGNTLEAFAGYLAIRRFCREPLFEQVANIIKFVIICFSASVISATIGVGSLLLTEAIAINSFWTLWSTWWFGDSIGALVFTPLICVWVLAGLKLPDRQNIKAIVAAGAITLGCGAIVFGNWLISTGAPYPLSFLFLPVAIWTTYRFRQHGATVITLVISIACILGTLQGAGPFHTSSLNDSLLLLQGFIAVVAVTTLTLGASLEEKRQHQQQLQQINRDLQRRVQERTRQLSEQLKNREQTHEVLETLLAISTTDNIAQFYQNCTRQLARLFQIHGAVIAVFEGNPPKALRPLAFWAGEQWLEDTTHYPIAGTAAQRAHASARTVIADEPPSTQSSDSLLARVNARSCVAVPLQTPEGTTVGVLQLMDTAPMALPDWAKPMLRIFANRIALEYQRDKAEEELRMAASVFKDTDEAIILTDRNRRIIRVNPAFERITGYTAGEAIGATPHILRSGYHDDAFYRELWRNLDTTGVWRGELWDRRKNGEVFPSWQTLSTVKDSNGDIVRYISIFSDISERKSIEENLYHLAHFDALTALYNRAAFVDMMEQAIARANRQHNTMALLFMDVDNFKHINDASGHAVGDQILKHVAAQIQSVVREEDIVARLGGDEFTLLLSKITANQDAATVAEKLLRGIQRPVTIEGIEVVITGSIGISIFPQDGTDSNTLMKNADAAMYRAKNRGRNAFQFFTAQMHKEALQRLSLEHDLRRALTQNAFSLHYQPQINAATGQMTACEALLRWTHPRKGMISPAVFIPVAEETGLIVPLGDWVINEACRQHRQWLDQGLPPVRVTVNMSGRQLSHERLIPNIERALETFAVEPAYLEIELTESSMMAHLDDNIAMFQRLRALGVQLSIDDFGTGYSSMAYLKRFPINRLKIDRSFVRDIVTDTDDAAIVGATIAMAHALHLAVVAEGVETRQQFDFLRERHCEEMQGYYFSKPLPADEFANLLETGDKPLIESNHTSSNVN